MILASDVAVGIPSFDHTLDLACAAGLLALAGSRAFARTVFVAGQADVRLARNQLVHSFLTETPCAHLVMIDADIGFIPQDFYRLLEGTEAAALAHYARKGAGLARVHAGLGFCRVARSVFDTLRPQCTPFIQNGVTLTDFFAHGPDADGAWQSEATAFWARLAAAHIPVRHDTRQHLTHFGRQGF